MQPVVDEIAAALDLLKEAIAKASKQEGYKVKLIVHDDTRGLSATLIGHTGNEVYIGSSKVIMSFMNRSSKL
jgi:histidine ammonia-lyase